MENIDGFTMTKENVDLCLPKCAVSHVPLSQAELTFCTGDIITVFGEIDEDGFYYVSWFLLGLFKLLERPFLTLSPCCRAS